VDAGEIEGLINYLVILLGIKVNDDEQNDMDIRMLVVGELIKTKFNHLTIPEIKEAFRMYVAREFSQIKPFRLLDAISAGEVLNAYDEYIRSALHVYNHKKTSGLLSSKTEPTESEKKIIREQWKADFMERYENGERTNDAWLMYDELIANGMEVTDDEKRKIYEQEQRKYHAELSQKAVLNPNIENRKELKGFIEMIEKNNVSQYIVNRCKARIVLEYLEKQNNEK